MGWSNLFLSYPLRGGFLFLSSSTFDKIFNTSRQPQDTGSPGIASALSWPRGFSTSESDPPRETNRRWWCWAYWFVSSLLCMLAYIIYGDPECSWFSLGRLVETWMRRPPRISGDFRWSSLNSLCCPTSPGLALTVLGFE